MTMNFVSSSDVVINGLMAEIRDKREEERSIYLPEPHKKWPELAPDAFTGIAGEFVGLATRQSEADQAAVLATFLARFAAEIGTQPILRVGDALHFPRIFVAVVGATSKARKGTSAKPVDRLFTLKPEVDPLGAATSPGPLSSGEGLVNAVRDKTSTWKPDPVKENGGEYITTDPGVADKRLYVCDEEFAAALKCIRREGNTLSAILRSAWDHGNIHPLTKSNLIKATGAHIVIVTHITRAELTKHLGNTELLNGLANRFLWILARRPKIVPFPEPMPDDELRRIQKTIIERIRNAHTETELSLSNEMRELWQQEYPALSAPHPGLVGGVISRAEAQVMRLSMIYALLDGNHQIGLKHLQAASAFWRFAKDSAKFIFNGRESNPHVTKIWVAIGENGQMNATDINRLFDGNLPAGEIQKALNELINDGIIEEKSVKTNGRPRKVYSLIDSKEKT